jgi:hypothetical protein
MFKEENIFRSGHSNIRILNLFRIRGTHLWVVGFRISAIAVIAAAGCSSNNSATTQPSTVTDRQNAALDDPFGYSPGMKDADISGGKVNEYDRNAMKKDLDHVLNP